MKRRLLLIIAVALALPLFALRASALTEDELVRQQEDAADTKSVAESIPDETLTALEALGVDPEHPTETVRKLTVGGLFDIVKSKLAGALAAPLHALAALLAVVLLSSAFADEKRRALRAAGAAGAGVAVIVPVASLAASASATLANCSVFISAALPVFASLTVSGGMPVSSAFLDSTVLALSNVISAVGAKVLLPVVCIGLAFSAVGAFAPELKTERIAAGIRGLAIWGVGATLALYLTFIGIQSGITSSLDGLTQKTLKVAISGSIPVVGGIISDASDTVLGAAQLIRSGMGGLALVVLALLFAKPLLTAAAWSLSLRLAEFAAASFGNDDVTALTGAARKSVTIIISLLAAAAVAVTVSVAILARLRV